MFQHSPILGDVAANLSRIHDEAGSAAADLLVTPELALTGYDVRDNAALHAVPLDGTMPWLSPLRDLQGVILTGLIEQGTPGLTYNTAAAFDRGKLLYRHRKIYLPTYGMFDEARHFAKGARLEPFDCLGWRFGVLICEDFWHPGLIYALAASRIDALIVLAAAPGRGVWEGGENGDFATADAWERMARVTAHTYGIYVALANRVGVEGGVTFAGGSLVAGPTGDVIARATSQDEMTLHATLSREELRRARRPAFHGRDDDPGLVLRELSRLVQHNV